MDQENLLPTPDTDGIHLRQYAMYYYNPQTDAVGWQFGLPPEDKFGSRNLTIRVVLQDGTVLEPKAFRIQDPDPENHRPGLPTWAWTPVKTSDGLICYARVIPPQEGKGSVPVERLPSDGIVRTPAGIINDDAPEKFYDLPFDIQTPTYDNGTYQLHAGRVVLAEVKIRGGRVETLRPSKPAYQLELWTSHLSRVLRTKVGFPHGSPERN